MISNASLHEDFLVVVHASLSQRKARRYWERGYRDYCREEMELTRAGAGAKRLPLDVDAIILRGFSSFPIHAAGRGSYSRVGIDQLLLLGAVMREKIDEAADLR